MPISPFIFDQLRQFELRAQTIAPQLTRRHFLQSALSLTAANVLAATLASYLWGFAPPPRVTNAPRTRQAVPALTVASTALARDLRQRGFRFVGPTTAYAFMQAMGLVNDHLVGCSRRAACERARRAFQVRLQWQERRRGPTSGFG